MHVVERFDVGSIQRAVDYFNQYGYAVLADAFDVGAGTSFWREVESQIGRNPRVTYSYYGQFYTGTQVPLEGMKLPRIVDIESHLPSAHGLMLAPSISAFLGAIYGRKPTCLQTLTYKYSSEQKAHSDKSLVNPPHTDGHQESMIASWLALEASDEENGALVIYPGSHTLPKRGFFDGFAGYDDYSDYVHEWCIAHGFHPLSFKAKQGDILFWHGDFVHAGGLIRSTSPTPPTRRSLVCHYTNLAEDASSLDQRWERRFVPGGSYFQARDAI